MKKFFKLLLIILIIIVLVMGYRYFDEIKMMITR